jgi:Beta-lactamase
VLMVSTRFGSGFFLPSSFSPLFGPASFGHAGAGGSLAFADADPERPIGFAYVMNRMQQNLAGDPRTLALIEALKRSL